MIAEKQGTTIRRYFYDGLTPILMEEGGQTYQFQTDHLATPRQMTDTLGNVMWTARLDAYGKVTTETGTVVNNLRFPGQYHDRETGLYYNWHRYYSPELGRYITSDPIGLVGGLNTYAYVGGNPVGAVDPMGLETEIIIWQPVGWGSSSFGHVSGQVNGVNYSFGPGGWDSNKSFAAYVERQQQFRSGTGVKLNLSAPEEHEFEQCLKNSGGEYDSIQNNCGTPFKDCLNYVGKKVGYPLFPADIGDNLLESPLYNGTTHYPGPTRSWWRDNWFTQ
jgi:RHS repeat-associated protein